MPWTWRLRYQVAGLCSVQVALLGGGFLSGRREVFLPGRTSDAHHVLEEACDTCHGGFERPRDERCIECHRPELAENTHPPALFDDPRWAADLALLDARRCLSCHREHTDNARAVSVARQFCFPCHSDVVEVRESHRNLGAGSCMDGGCHNYHDNSALNPSFLGKRLGRPATHAPDRLLAWGGQLTAARGAPRPEVPPGIEPDRALVASWQASAHASEGVGCMDCHRAPDGRFGSAKGVSVCAGCHGFEAETFGAGKHGARSAIGLPSLRPEQARRPMRADAAQDGLGCASCHDPHRLDTRRAAVDACLGCHDDDHSRAYRNSPHAALGATGDEADARPPAGAVTCATCHLPRVEIDDQQGRRTAVHHNNSWTFAPRDRLVKLVCLDCHGLELSLSAVFDDVSVRSNFARPPADRHPAVRMVEQVPDRRRRRP